MAFNRNDPADLAALKSEVETDPLAIGYDVNGNIDQTILALINAKNYTVGKPKISAADVRSATTYDAYNNLSIDEQEWLRWVTGSNGFEQDNVPVTADLRQQLAGDPAQNSSIWAVANRTEMNAAMLALMNVPGSRAEVLFGYGTSISRDDWFAARDYQP